MTLSVKRRISLLFAITILSLSCACFVMAKKQTLGPSYAWRIEGPLAERYLTTIDTLQLNYHKQAVPTLPSHAWVATGNYGAEGMNMIFFDRKPISEFFFADQLSAWIPSFEKQVFYNTRIPMTLLSYNTGGGKNIVQDRLRGEFSGNVNKRLQFGAALDYIYSKGSYNYQSDKDFTWRLSSSYIGDRYELQTYFNNYNFLNKENGGITDDRYITDLVDVAGVTKLDSRSIPVYLSAAHSRLIGHDFFMNHRYKLGHYDYVRDSLTDSIKSKNFVPVTSFIYSFQYKTEKHLFLNQSSSEESSQFANHYLSTTGTDDETRYWKVANTFGIQLHEGFHKFAKFGVSAFIRHEYRRYYQANDSALGKYTPLSISVPHIGNENQLYVGGQLTKKKGDLLKFNVLAQFGVLGSVAGDVDVSGDISTQFRCFKDSMSIRAFAYFKNLEAPYLTKHFLSNHYAWDNSFKKTQRFRVGGELNIRPTGSKITAGYEIMSNYIYFDSISPKQYSDKALHVFSITLEQKLHWRALHWDNIITYQKSSNQAILPMPELAIYSNLYVHFPIVRVLKVQFGIDCNYYTRYAAPRYNPSLMTFYNQDLTDESKVVKVGNYPIMNVYINFKLYKARFFVMFSHVNQGWFSKNSFIAPHYPYNPRRFQFGVSVDFAN